MLRIKEWLWVVFVSYEMLAIVVVSGVAFLWPCLPRQIGQMFEGMDPEIQISIIAFPFLLIGLVFKFSKDILNPGEHRKVVVEWEDYWKLKVIIQAALGFSAASCVVMIVGLFFVFQSYLAVGAAMIVASLSVSCITLVSVALALINEQDILDGASGA